MITTEAIVEIIKYQRDWAAWASLIISAVTFVTIALYTIFSFKNSEAVKDQLSLSLSAFFTVDFQSEDLSRRIQLRENPFLINIGKGTAINIDISIKEPSYNKEYYLSTSHSPLLYPYNHETNKPRVKLSKRMRSNFVNWDNEKECKGPHPYKFKYMIKFKDVFGNDYLQTIAMDGVNAKPSKVKRL